MFQPIQRKFHYPLENPIQYLTYLVCRCLYSVFVMHRRTDLWGPDGTFVWYFRLALAGISIKISPAHVFDPDRFIDERLGKYLIPNPFIFLPFNAGPRICLGQQVILVVFSTIPLGFNTNSDTSVCVPRNIIFLHPSPPEVFRVHAGRRCTAG